jgi:ABC-type lipoprotein release transport system permease subunit
VNQRAAEASPRLHWVIAWRHLRVGDRPPAWAWPAFGLALYFLAVGAGFWLYAVYGLDPLPAHADLPLALGPLEHIATPSQTYFGLLAAITLLVGAAMLLGAVLSLVFTLLATVITVSVMLGCMALVVVLSLMTGLELELRDKIIGQRAHIRVTATDGRPFADYLDLSKELGALPGILGASPYLQGEVMVRSGFQRQGGILLGIDPDLHAGASDLPKILREGDYDSLAHPEKIPESGFGFEILPIDPPAPTSDAPVKVEPEKADPGKGATALPPAPEFKDPAPGSKDPAAKRDDDDDDGWEDPETELGLTDDARPGPRAEAKVPARKRVPKSPAAAIPSIPRGDAFHIVVDEGEGWEDPEVEIGKLRAAGKLPPPAAGSGSPTTAETPDEQPTEPAEPTEEASADKPQFEGIFIGSEKAKELAARTGDQVQLITPIGRLTPAGRIPGVMAVKIAGVFDADHYEYDRWLVYSKLSVAQAFLRAGDRVTGIEIKIDDIDRLDARRDAVAAAVAASGRTDLVVQDWQELNRSLFSAMALEKIAVFVALLCVILVASFGILGSNLMSVIEKAKEIAILKAMGCTDKLIQRIFISEGLCLGILGGTLGLASGRVFCALLGRFGLPLGGNLESFEKLPVAVDPLEVFLVGMSALFIVWLSSIYPARIASRIRPIDAFRQAER